MQFSLTNVVDALAISLFLYLLVVLNDHRKRGGLRFPPGPPTWPIIGNLLDVPKNAPWIAYSDMSKKYGRHLILRNWLALAETRVPGDVICLRIFSQVVVVLCSVSAIRDLLEKRGEIYSDRPHLPITEMSVCNVFFTSRHADNFHSLARISIGPCSLPD
jgi:hypothetical protein